MSARRLLNTGPHTVGRRCCAVTSVLQSKTLAQGQFTCPEHIKCRRVK